MKGWVVKKREVTRQQQCAARCMTVGGGRKQEMPGRDHNEDQPPAGRSRGWEKAAQNVKPALFLTRFCA